MGRRGHQEPRPGREVEEGKGAKYPRFARFSLSFAALSRDDAGLGGWAAGAVD